MNHTPGPYPLNYDCNTDGKYCVWTNQGNLFANTFDPSAAKAITAIPDLLSALVMAKNWMDVEADYGKDKWEKHDQAIYDDIMESINQAINKATQ